MLAMHTVEDLGVVQCPDNHFMARCDLVPTEERSPTDDEGHVCDAAAGIGEISQHTPRHICQDPEPSYGADVGSCKVEEGDGLALVSTATVHLMVDSGDDDGDGDGASCSDVDLKAGCEAGHDPTVTATTSKEEGTDGKRARVATGGCVSEEPVGIEDAHACFAKVLTLLGKAWKETLADGVATKLGVELESLQLWVEAFCVGVRGCDAATSTAVSHAAHRLVDAVSSLVSTRTAHDAASRHRDVSKAIAHATVCRRDVEALLLGQESSRQLMSDSIHLSSSVRLGDKSVTQGSWYRVVWWRWWVEKRGQGTMESAWA